MKKVQLKNVLNDEPYSPIVDVETLVTTSGETGQVLGRTEDGIEWVDVQGGSTGGSTSGDSCKCGDRWSYLGMVEFDATYTTTNNEKLNLPESNSVILHEWDSATNKGKIQFNANGVPKMFFYLQDTLKTIEIVSPCQKLGMEAFRGCTSLEQITIGDTVLKLGERSFQNCQPLNNVTIPEGVKEIPDACFIGCHVYVETDYTGTKKYRDGLTTINLPESLERIGNEAFEDCTSLTELAMPKNVKSIGYRAFQQCENLTITDWDFFNNLEELDEKAFQSCHKLRFPDGVLTIPEKITEVKPETFSFCYAIDEIKLHNKVTRLDAKAFYTCGNNGGSTTRPLVVNKINIPSSVKFIGKQCFASDRSADGKTGSTVGHISIKAIDIEDINDYVNIEFEDKNSHPNSTAGSNRSKLFINGEEFRDVVIMENISELDQYMFAYMDIDSVSLPDSVNRVETRAFEYSGIKNVDFSNCKNLSFIGNYAFYGTNVSDFNLSGCDLSEVEENAFYWFSCQNANFSNTNLLTLPDSTMMAEHFNFSGSKITSIPYKAFNNSMRENKTKSYDFSNCKNLETVGMQAFVKGSTIESVSFDGCTNLKSIGEQAFSECSNLSQVNLSNLPSLTTIVRKAFEKCTNLRTIDLSGCPNLVEIGEQAFYGGSSSVSMVEEIDLSVCPKLTTIGNKAFPHITKLTVNDTASYLGEMERWTSNASSPKPTSNKVLTEVIIKGTTNVVDGLYLTNPTYYVDETMEEAYKAKYPELKISKIS